MSAPYSDTPAEAPIPVKVRRDAAGWLVELQSRSVSASTLDRWRAWRAAHPDHERAWQRIEAFEGKLQTLSSPLAHATLAQPASAQRRRAIQKLALVLFAGGTAWAIEDRTPWRTWTADHHTDTGERTAFTLADGTRIEMNARTAINIHYTDTERLVRLVSGEILVTTAPDSAAVARPFIVETAQGRARAIGTRYAVLQQEGDHADHSHITVFDGAVEIHLGNGRVRRIEAGEQATFTREHINAPDVADEGADAWTQGMIVAHDMPLARFLEALARHRTGRLACAPEIAALRVSGTYPVADTDKVLDILQRSLPIQVRRLTRYWITLHPRQG